MKDTYMKITRQINKKILNEFNNLDYMQKLRAKKEKFNNESIEEFFNSIIDYILINELSINIKKFIVFWIDYIIDNHKADINSYNQNVMTQLIKELDLYPLITSYDSDIKQEKFESLSLLDEIDFKIRYKNKKILSNIQLLVRNKIKNKNNIIFTAPTSFGKSSIVIDTIKEMIDNKQISKVVIILPSKALINEYRAKVKRVLNDIPIIETPYIIDNYEKVIFLYTPERFIIFNENNKFSKIDYAICDEVQMLISISKKNSRDRSILLAKTISIIKEKKIPIIFLMPFITEPYKGFISKFVNFNKNEIINVDENITPFVSNNYYVLDIKDKNLIRYDFSKDAGISNVNYEIICNTNNINKNELYEWEDIIINNLEKIIEIDKKFIIFCTGKEYVKQLAEKYINKQEEKINKKCNRMKALIKYIEENISPDFEYISFLKKGIAIHFSELDSYMKRQVEIIFNTEDDIKGIISTSTLLQGVNISAKNMILFYGNRFSSFGNSDIDFRNLLGRTARLGINIQGNIFAISCMKNIEREGKKLYQSSEPVKINIEKEIKAINVEESEILKTYVVDKNIDSDIKEKLKKGEENINVPNYDYFIGVDKGKEVEQKIKKENIKEYKELLKSIGDYENTVKLIKILKDIYDWENSDVWEVKNRLINVEGIARLACYIYNGYNTLNMIKSDIKYCEKHKEYKLIVCKNIKGHEYVKIIKKDKWDKNYECDYDNNKHINIYIYSIFHDVQKLIEYELKKYIQDFYYRIRKFDNEKIDEVEMFLDFSTNDRKKIMLNSIGIVDQFAINTLSKSEFDSYFDENNYIKEKDIKEYANNLEDDNPLKYAILDVI